MVYNSICCQICLPGCPTGGKKDNIKPGLFTDDGQSPTGLRRIGVFSWIFEHSLFDESRKHEIRRNDTAFRIRLMSAGIAQDKICVRVPGKWSGKQVV